MPFDGLVLAAIKKELIDGALNITPLLGSRIDRIYQPAPLELNIVLRQPGNRNRLLISAHASEARIHLTEHAKENPASPPLFCMVLRKHLEGGRIVGLAQEGLERILVFQIEVRNEINQLTQKNLVCEFMGKHSNVILVDATTQTIIDSIKRYSFNLSRYREVLPGRTYLHPPKQDKLALYTLNEAIFQENIWQQPLAAKLEQIIQRRFEGLSTLMSREIIYRAGLPADLILNECGEYEINVLEQKLKLLCQAVRESNFPPALMVNEAGEPVEFAAFPLTHLRKLTARKATMNVIVDQFFTFQEERSCFNQKKQRLISLVQKEINYQAKKISTWEENLTEADKAEKFKLYGKLLLANAHCLEKGLTEVSLANFHDPSSRVLISLDPQLSPVENANAFFKKYQKAKKTRLAIQPLLENARQERFYLLSVETALQQASTLSDLAEISQELMTTGYLAKTTTGQKSKDKPKPKQKTSAPLKFISSDNLTILVGKNNRQNDYLTMRLAQENDVWLHTKEIPGSHVVIKTNGQPVPPTTLQEAAILAAFFSRAQQSHNVPVDYTGRKNVKKPPGARPGFVTYTNHRTIIVNPDKSLPAKLQPYSPIV